MIALIGSGLDAQIGQVVSDWPGAEALWVKLEDMTGPGWRIDPADPVHSFIRAGGRDVRVSELQGAVVACDHIDPELLYMIRVEDRAYMAQEIESLITTLCAMIQGPVVNAPFSDRYKRRRLPEQWLQAASGMGIPCFRAEQGSGTAAWLQRHHPMQWEPCPDQAQEWTGALATAAGAPFVSATWMIENDVPKLAHITTHAVLASPDHVGSLHQLFKTALA